MKNPQFRFLDILPLGLTLALCAQSSAPAQSAASSPSSAAVQNNKIPAKKNLPGHIGLSGGKGYKNITDIPRKREKRKKPHASAPAA
jgi:hypothetical protein